MNKEINTNRLNLLWLRAAILGSIWASSEIILGSFLHNLRIPFSGTFLSAIGVYLLIAFDVKWQHPGVIWRAGIICALMKSISPSAVIFGPMIAIAMEAFLLNGTVKIIGRNILGYGIGGALAVTWSLLHKIINMLIFYGPDIIEIYKNLYKYAEKMTSLKLGSPADLIIVLFAAYLLIGFTVAVFAVLAGRKAVPLELEVKINEDSGILPSKNRIPYEKHSLLWLAFEITMAAAGLFVLSNYDIRAGFVFTVLVTAINLIRYKKLLSKRLKPKFWIELAVITTAAGFLMGGIKADGWEFSLENLAEGFRITLRALLLTECLGLIGIELANPAIKKFFGKMRLGMLPAALETACQALPLMHAIITSHKDKFRRPSMLISGYITTADNWIAGINERC
jgi:hypothetical protein